MTRPCPIDQYRNIGLMAHIDAGRTTTAERMLDAADRAIRMRAAPKAIAEIIGFELAQSPATSCSWRGHRINIIETPGHVDLGLEIDRWLRVVDGAVTVIDAVAGVLPQAEVLWRSADKHGVPRICFLNKMDVTGADFEGCVEMIRDRLGVKPLVAQLPIVVENEFVGVVDLVAMKGVAWKATTTEPIVGDIPSDMRDEAAALHRNLVETCVELDEAIWEAHLEGKQPETDTLKKLIRKGAMTGAFVPVLCGSAFKDKGMELLLDAIVDYLPSPIDVPAVNGVEANGDQELSRKARDDEPFSSLAFNMMADPLIGSMTFLRVYSGVLTRDTELLNPIKRKAERVGRILQMHANHREDLKEARAGDIVAVTNLKVTTPGDTLCDSARPIILEPLEFPDPVIEVPVEPNSKADEEKMVVALERLAQEDPSFRAISYLKSGQTIIKGQSELHLEIIVDRMKREFKVEMIIGAPQVAYREAITRTIEWDYTHKGGEPPRYAKVKIRFEPGEAGSGFVFENAATRGSVPPEFVPGVRSGLATAKETGVIAGFPMMDLKCTLIDGDYHDVDSSVMAFEFAARACFREAMSKVRPKVVEPMMKVEVVTPQDYMGDVIGDLNSRRGQVQGMDSRRNAQVITAMVPLANMFGYVNTLRSMTQGRAYYSMRFDHYEQVPPNPRDGDDDFPMAAALRW